MSSTKSPVLKLVEEIIAADPGVRFASIIDKNGDVVEGIMNSGKTNLKSQQEEEYFCKQVAKRRKIRKASLGIALRTGGAGKTYADCTYPTDYTIYFTLEPEMGVVERVHYTQISYVANRCCKKQGAKHDKLSAL